MKTQLSTLLLIGVIGCGRVEVVTEIDLPIDFNGSSQLSDMDNDGDTDLVASGFAGFNIIASQDGQFLAPVNITITNFGLFLLADLDGDALPELLTTDGVSLLSSPNEGGLSLGAATSILALPSNRALAAADVLGGDARSEILGLVTPDGSSFELQIFANNNGAIDPNPIVVSLAPPPLFEPNSIHTGDLDADGDIDCFIFGNSFDDEFFLSTAGVATILNNGDGTFTEQEFVSLEGNGFNGLISARDIDDDADVDFAFVGFDSNFQSSVVLLRSDGATLTTETIEDTQDTTSLQLVDLDNDGAFEVVTTTRTNEAFGYQTEKIVVLRSESGEFKGEEHQIRDIDQMNLLGAADLDGDALPELWVTGFLNNSFEAITLFGLRLP